MYIKFHFYPNKLLTLKTQTPPIFFISGVFKSDQDGIRTHDPQLRRLLLYPAELPDPLSFNKALQNKLFLRNPATIF